MVAPTVTTDLFNITTSESTTGWSALGGGAAGLTQETDFYIQGSFCTSKQITGAGTLKGQVYDNGTGVDISTASGNTCYIWIYMSTNQLPDTTALGGLRVRVGSGGSATAVYKEFYVYGSDTYARGGWKRVAFDPEKTANASAGTLATNAIQWFGAQALVTGTSKGTNLGVDRIDVGQGHITSNGEVSNPINFGNVSVFDDSNTNRYGVFYLQDGTYQQQGRIKVGPQDTTNTTCYFTERANTISFTNSWVSDRAYGWNIRGRNTTFTWTDININNLGFNRGLRGDFIVDTTGGIGDFGPATPAAVTVTGGVWDGMREIILANTALFNGLTISNSGPIAQNGANIFSCTITNPTDTYAVLCNDANLISYCTFTKTVAANTHAIQITQPGTYDFIGNEFVNYGTTNGLSNTAIWNNSGGTVTLNVVGGGSPSYNNSPTSTTVINNSVTLTIEGIQTDSEVRIYSLDTTLQVFGNENTTGQVQSVSIRDGGTGYTVNDVLTVVGGTGTAATLTVDAVSGGVITAVSITSIGDYSVNPINPVSVTGGTGSGAQFALTISGSISYSYNATAGQFVDIIIFHKNYKEIRFSNFELDTASQTIPVQQITDRVYSNV